MAKITLDLGFIIAVRHQTFTLAVITPSKHNAQCRLIEFLAVTENTTFQLKKKILTKYGNVILNLMENNEFFNKKGRICTAVILYPPFKIK